MKSEIIVSWRTKKEKKKPSETSIFMQKGRTQGERHTYNIFDEKMDRKM
jgi:hypothetical protein